LKYQGLVIIPGHSAKELFLYLDLQLQPRLIW
jgi:hypothetical protein